MKKTGFLILFALVLTGMFAARAEAIPVTSTFYPTNNPVTLGNWNVLQLNGAGDYVTLTITNGITNTVVTNGTEVDVQWHAGLTNTLNAIGIDKVGFNTTATLIAPSGWSPSIVQTMDGFGTFLVYSADPASLDGISSPIKFYFTSASISFPTNSIGSQFAAHVRYGNNCSGFVANGATSSGASSNSDCGSTPVPEPSTLLLLGSGLVGAGFWFRRRK